GENGAGKTTLMKLLYGLLSPDLGKVFIRGMETAITSPAEAIKKRIGMVHQHFELAPNLTVAENVILGLPAKYGFLLDLAQSKKEIAKFCLVDYLKINPDVLVSNLSVGEQQRVEILKALYRRAEILILDEPTAVLTPQESEKLFVSLRRLRDEGKSIVFISHKLKEVLAVSDRIVVLRQGRKVSDISRAEATEESLAALMMGRSLIKSFPERRKPEEQAVLNVQNLTVPGETGRPALSDLSFTVRQGEIVGVASVSGNGQKEMMDKLFGLLPASAGRVFINGKDVTDSAPAELIGMNIARIPEDRLGVGTIPDLSVWENLVIERRREPPCSRNGLVSHQACFKTAAGRMAEFQIKAASIQAPVGSLSGGNIQKVVLARELAGSPPLILAEQPTRGLDAGGADFVHQAFLRAAQAGSAILLVSEDLDELLSLSNRILVLYEGKIIGDVDRKDASLQKLGLLMAGICPARGKAEDAP
ncbi:MAG: ABC transporter ATP-binding protein, partial [bacterium]